MEIPLAPMGIGKRQKVVPEQHVMGDGSNRELRPQPAVPGNGCCCVCCGKHPGPVEPKKIVDDGGRFVQAADGRVIEYFVYGSENKDARILLQINGSMGTGWLFAHAEGIVAKLKEHNIKAISITVPGHAYSTVQPTRKIGDWPRDDVRPVFQAEGIDGEFMVEGVSFGASHALAVAHHFEGRVSALHVAHPYIPIPLREELGFEKYMEDDKLKCDPEYAQACKSCCLFSCCSCLHYVSVRCPGCLADDQTKKVDAEVPGASKLSMLDVARSGTFCVHGWLYNGFVPTISDNWGFDLREITTAKVMVSYAEDDPQCDPKHGEFLAKHFQAFALKFKVNVSPKEAKMGHNGHSVKLVSGAFVTMLAEL